MDEETYQKLKKIIDEICAALQAGEKIKKTTRVKGLCWIWSNPRTKEEWVIGAPTIVTMKLLNETDDPRVTVIANFVHNHLTPPETKTRLEQLEKLRAFW